MGRIEVISVELTVDPLGRGYSGMTDEAAAASMDAVDRPDSISIEEVLKFLVLDNTYKSDDGTDTQDRAIWQRMKEVVALAVTPSEALPDPWGSASIGNITEIQQVKTHTLFDFFTITAQGSLAVDLTSSNFKVYLAGARSAGCMSFEQEQALLDLADNQQSRGSEIGVGTVRTNDITQARAA